MIEADDIAGIVKRACGVIRYQPYKADAWEAAAEEWWLNSEATEKDLYKVATRAARAALDKDMRDRGLEHNTTGRGHAVYWMDRGKPLGHPEGILEGMAAWQVFAQLTDQEQDTLKAVMNTDTIREAAEFAGVGSTVFGARLARARQSFLTKMFDHETPPTVVRRGPNAR